MRSKQEIDLDNDPPPDLVLKIDITSSSLDKRPIYAAIGVPELWQYSGKKLEVFVLELSSQGYQQFNQNPSFPCVPQLGRLSKPHQRFPIGSFTA